MSSDRALVPRPKSSLPVPVRRMGEKPHFMRSRKWPLRGIFMSAMASTMIGAAVVGSALAWTNQEFVSGEATVGEVTFGIVYQPTGQIAQPAGGIPVRVGQGAIQNTGVFTLRYESSTAQITGVTNGPLCTVDMFAIAAVPFGTLPFAEIKPGVTASGFDVNVATLPNVAPECDGATLSFTTNFVLRAR